MTDLAPPSTIPFPIEVRMAGTVTVPETPPGAHATREQALAAAADEQLVRRVAAGDRAAYGELVARHLDRTVTVAARILGDRAEAEDVAQEAFLRLWRNAAAYRPGTARFGTWFYRVTVNLCLDRRRKPRTEALEAAGDPADDRPDAVDGIARREAAGAVARAVEALPERQRAAVSLCYDSGLSNAEAARAMDVSVGALETLLVRARKALRASLAAFAPEGGPTTTTKGKGGPRG
ncbi:MAG TPA: RNA polymerase sigma factor [Azospirillaceae bacterium]|nr:RNA polymerase sigma factor [Azospirillaceae bacterium]